MKHKYTKIIISLALLVVITDALMISIKVYGFYSYFTKYEQISTAMTSKPGAKIKQSEVKAMTYKQS